MKIIDKMRRQRAVLWVMTGYGDNGQPTYSTAREIRVRWEEKTEEMTGVNTSKFVSKAMIYVGEDIPLRSILWLGKISQLTSITDPKLNDHAFELQRLDIIPTIKANKFLRIAYL